MRPFPQGMSGMGPHMLRKIPQNFGGMGQFDMKMPMDMMMQQGMHMGGNMMNPMMQNMPPMNMPMNNMMDVDPEIMNDPQAKRNYFGERLYTKISSNPNYSHVSDLFSKIVGIFLDLEEPVIERLINDDTYFDVQVRETMRLLAEKGSSN